MINLPNGCKCSTISVHPKNWQSKSAKTTTDWYLSYRFYDPLFAKPKQVMVQGMNQFKTLTERQEATKNALSQELDKLLNQAFNPFIKLNKAIVGSPAISPETNISEALQFVYKKIQVSERTLMDIKYVLRSVDKAIGLLGYVENGINFLAKKYGESSYLLTIKIDKPGEYGLLLGTNKTVTYNDKSINNKLPILCFSVAK